MARNKRDYCELMEEIAKRIIKDKNKIASYLDTKLKKQYDDAGLGWTTIDDEITIELKIRRNK